MENDVAHNVRRGYADDVTDVFQDDEAVRKIFPEEARIFVQDDLDVTGRSVLQVLAGNRDHGERDSAVAQIRVEDALEVAFVADLAVIHCANALLDGHDLVEIYARVFRQDRGLNGLNFAVESCDFVGALLIETLVEQGHILEFEHRVRLVRELVEEAGDSAGMNDLVARTKRQVQEGRNGHGGCEETLRDRVGYKVNAIHRI